MKEPRTALLAGATGLVGGLMLEGLLASQAAFRAVHLDANLSVARAAASAGARRVGLVSAAGADAHSSMFYNRVKGELEDALRAMDRAGVG